MTAISTYLRRGGLALVAVAVGGFAADFVLNVGLSRLLPAHEYGDYKVAHAFAAFFGVAVLLGGDRAAPKALAGPLAAGETARAWEYLRFYLRLGLALSAAVVVATWAASVLHFGTADPRGHHALAWMALAVPVHATGALASRALQSARYPVLASLPWRVGAPALFLLLVGVASRRSGDVALPQVVLLAVATVVLVTGWQWWELRRRRMPRFDRDPAARTPRRWLTTSVPMMGAFLVTLALSQSDLYFLEVLGDEAEVGLYAAAATSAHFLLLIQTTVVGLIAPLVQPALETGPEAALDARRQGERLLLVGLVPAAAILVLAARPILSLFGAGYADAAPVLALLVAGNLTWAAASLSTLWLQYTDRGTVVVAVTVATLAVDSLLNAVLIPRFGMEGAAGGTAVTMTLAAAALVAARRRSTRAA